MKTLEIVRRALEAARDTTRTISIGIVMGKQSSEVYNLHGLRYSMVNDDVEWKV